jgi:hypothetical protein
MVRDWVAQASRQAGRAVKPVMAIAASSGYCGGPNDIHRTARRMTGPESRSLAVGSRVCWRDDKDDQATVTETTWSGVTLKWDNRGHQSVLHNDMEAVGTVSRK